MVGGARVVTGVGRLAAAGFGGELGGAEARDFFTADAAAQIALRDAEIAALDVEQWDQIMSMNLRGFYLCCKHALAVMRTQKSGVILCISSAAALASGSNMTY